MVAWINEAFIVSQTFVTINTFAQLYAVFYLLAPASAYSLSKEKGNVWTHLVAKTFAGIGVLDLIDNGGVAFVSAL